LKIITFIVIIIILLLNCGSATGRDAVAEKAKKAGRAGVGNVDII